MWCLLSGMGGPWVDPCFRRYILNFFTLLVVRIKSFQHLGLLAEDVSISAIVFQMFLYNRYVQEPTGNVTGIIRSLVFGSVAYIFSSGCTTKFCTRCQTRESKSPEAPWSYIKIEMNTSINSLAEISIPAVQRVGVSPWTLSLLKMCQWNHEYHRC